MPNRWTVRYSPGRMLVEECAYEPLKFGLARLSIILLCQSLPLLYQILYSSLQFASSEFDYGGKP